MRFDQDQAKQVAHVQRGPSRKEKSERRGLLVFSEGTSYFSSILSTQRFPGWKRRTPLLYMFRLFVSPVSWVRLFWASAPELFAPNGLQQAQ
jgi:hypothetical protein